MIRFDNVGLRYGSGPEILRDITFHVLAGSFHFLTGPSGAGKTTLLNALTGSRPADTGTVEFFGQEVTFETPHDAQRAGIVTIYQEFTLAPDMTIAENVWI